MIEKCCKCGSDEVEVYDIMWKIWYCMKCAIRYGIEEEPKRKKVRFYGGRMLN